MLKGMHIAPTAGEMRVELDKKSLFALASDTRLEILRSLQPMRRTISQLAEAIGIDKAAVHRHLRKLEEGGLVKRYEDHGFVYYGLSWKARDLMSPNENTKIIIMLSASWLSIAGVAILTVVALFSGDGVVLSSRPPETAGYEGLTEESGGVFGSLHWLWWLVPSIVLALTAVVLSLKALRYLRKPKQSHGA